MRGLKILNIERSHQHKKHFSFNVSTPSCAKSIAKKIKISFNITDRDICLLLLRVIIRGLQPSNPLGSGILRIFSSSVRQPKSVTLKAQLQVGFKKNEMEPQIVNK